MSTDQNEEIDSPAPESNVRHPAAGRSWLLALGIFSLALAALVPTIGDFGLTWDEPAYRYSQIMSQQWWEQLGHVRSSRDVQALLDPDVLFYFWPYGRHGINFHPPWAGQLNLAAYAIFGHWMKDIPARRMATVIQFALTITLGFQFLAKRYGFWAGAAAGGSLLFMPRLYGQAHLVDSDIPGLLLWVAAAIACWKGLHEPDGRRWRVAVGVLAGLAFIEKMAAVVVLFPLLLWLCAVGLPRAIARRGARAAWIDGILTTGLLLAPLALAFQQIQMLQRQLPPPQFIHTLERWPVSDWPGAILAVPLLFWFGRRLLGKLFPRSEVWGVERPVLETWTAVLAFAPVVGWLGNPVWWRETLPRLAHYYTLSMGRRGALPDISIIYFGRVYEFSLPWHNGWVLLAITVPLLVLGPPPSGSSGGSAASPRPPSALLSRSLPDPPRHPNVSNPRARRRSTVSSHVLLSGGVRGLGYGLAGGRHLSDDAVGGELHPPRRHLPGALHRGCRAYGIHPYELSYYNELAGGPRGAWDRGFELTYWYDAFTPAALEDLNRRLPPSPQIDFMSKKTESAVAVFADERSLGSLRGDVVLGWINPGFPFVWLLTQDSKATSFTRLLFAMRPWYARAGPVGRCASPP